VSPTRDTLYPVGDITALGNTPAVGDRSAPSLAEEQRQVARDRLYRAAWAVLADQGLSATADEIAEAAGVSVRTVFRHFGTRDQLVAESLRAQLRTYRDDHLGPPADDESLESWLARLLLSVHQRNAVLGRAYWEMIALRTSLPGEVAEAAEERRAARARLVKLTTTAAWRLVATEPKPPAWLFDVFAVHLSAFAAQALTADLGRSADQVADISARALAAAVRSAATPLATPS
jgi:AcrR family transcriptional regulator